MTNRFMHGWTRPHHSHQFSFLHQVSPTAWRCFCLLQLCIPVIYPCVLLSANTFTFLVLLSNKRGGMRGDLLTLLKQTSWTPSAEEPPPPSLPQQSIQPSTLGCCSTVHVNSVAVSSRVTSYLPVHFIGVLLTQECPWMGLIQSGVLTDAVISLSVKELFSKEKLATEVPG